MNVVKNFRYLRNRLNASGGSEAWMTVWTRMGWIKFRECEEMLCGRKLLLKIKGRIFLQLC